MVNVEVCIDSFESARIIASEINNHAGHRIELCSNLVAEGGLTPSLGLFLHIAEIIDPGKIMVMIRPRTGSFVYTESEVLTMICDIQVFKQQGVGGFVLGCLQDDGQIDIDVVERLVRAAIPCEVTFHRAFDVTPDWETALQDILTVSGVTRILTSGHAARAIEGVDELASMVSAARSADRAITIVPASGINAITGPELLKKVPGLTELHLSSSALIRPRDTPAILRGEALGFGKEEWKLIEAEISQLWKALAEIRNINGNDA